MNLEQSQTFANISSGLANLVAAGIMSREQAKGIIKLYLPNENIGNHPVNSTRSTAIKQTINAAADVK